MQTVQDMLTETIKKTQNKIDEAQLTFDRFAAVSKSTMEDCNNTVKESDEIIASATSLIEEADAKIKILNRQIAHHQHESDMNTLNLAAAKKLRSQEKLFFRSRTGGP